MVNTDLVQAAPAVDDVDREVEFGYAEHARDALLHQGQDEPGAEIHAPAPLTGLFPFGGVADHRSLRAATRGLPPKERRVVRMRLFGHGSPDTIAAVLDLPRPQVTLLLARGLSRIRHDLLT